MSGTVKVNQCNPEAFYSVLLPVGTYTITANVPPPYIAMEPSTAKVTITKDQLTHYWFNVIAPPHPIFDFGSIKSGNFIRAEGTTIIYAVNRGIDGVWTSRKFSTEHNFTLMFGTGALNSVKNVSQATLDRFTNSR